MRQRPFSRAIVASAIALLTTTTAISVSAAAPASSHHASTARSPKTTTLSMNLTPFTPTAPTPGGHDNYHCSLLFPGTTTDQMITSTTFNPGTIQVHHVILYLGYSNQLANAQKLNNNGKGWTCFGAPQLSGKASTVAEIGANPWLASSGPGHNTSYEPPGTGMPLPAGAFIIVQVHYNLLVGCGKNGKSPTDKSTVVLTTETSQGSSLKPLKIDTIVAPPDLPCPTGSKGALCTRSKSLTDLGKRFGQAEVNFVNLIEYVCGRSSSIPSATSNVTSTSCVMPVGGAGYIQAVAPHMHLLGATMTVTLNPDTPSSQVLLNETSYNFDLQRGTVMVPPVHVTGRDRIRVTCTYTPALRSLLPQLRALPPRYITWGDGSSDEMCLAVIARTTS